MGLVKRSLLLVALFLCVEIRTLEDATLIKDLLKAGYIMPMEKIVRGRSATKSKGGKK